MNDTKDTKEAAKPDANKSLQALREGYQNSLNQTQQQIAQLSNTLNMLNQKVEQLKGAIFGLQELETQMNPGAKKEAAPAAPAADAKAGKSGKSAKAAEVTKASAKSEEKAAASGTAQ